MLVIKVINSNLKQVSFVLLSTDPTRWFISNALLSSLGKFESNVPSNQGISKSIGEDSSDFVSIHIYLDKVMSSSSLRRENL